MALARDSHRTRPCAYWKFEDMWSRSDPTYVYPLEGIFDVLILRKHQLVTLDARSLVGDVADYNEGVVWSHSVPVALAFLHRPKLLQASVEATLTELNVDPTSTQDIARGILRCSTVYKQQQFQYYSRKLVGRQGKRWRS
ncbi:hypothetical protein CDL15_Pgr000355 [Punica granatum]|uniref:Uncharacterized protein n=1 Tax=Punica granatum TaxID=22663 RepID=A0A218XSZ9_PUNGR|nr:hypothetical protein CDL15_Pgr000355 [Punica granatum]PKI67298.1 hypothetical protein CRG98_012315 [Punica granatum]